MRTRLVVAVCSAFLMIAGLFINKISNNTSSVSALTIPQELLVDDLASMDLSPPAVELDDIAFLDRDGQEWRLGDFRGDILVVNLWATWCAPCIKEVNVYFSLIVLFLEGGVCVFFCHSKVCVLGTLSSPPSGETVYLIFNSLPLAFKTSLSIVSLWCDCTHSKKN